MSRPFATLSIDQPASPDPTRRDLRITTNRSDHHLVYGWFFTGDDLSSQKVGAPEAPGGYFFKVTDSAGVCSVPLREQDAAGFRAAVSVLGVVATSPTPVVVP